MEEITSFLKSHWPWLLGGVGIFLVYEYYSSSSSGSAPATSAEVLTGENSALAAANESSANAGTVAQMNYQLGMAQAQAPVQVAQINAAAATQINQTNATASEYNLTTAAELDAGQYSQAIQAAQNITAETLSAEVALGTQANEVGALKTSASVKTAQIKGQSAVASTMASGYASAIGSLFSGLANASKSVAGSIGSLATAGAAAAAVSA